jgi:hypothetical protein
MLDYLPLLVLLVSAGLALALWMPRWLVRLRVGRDAPSLRDIPCLKDADEGDAFVYFFSPRCSGCRPVGEAVERLRRGGARVIEIDISRCRQAAQRFGIREIPAVVSVTHGRIARVLIGPQAARALSGLSVAPHG